MRTDIPTVEIELGTGEGGAAETRLLHYDLEAWEAVYEKLGRDPESDIMGKPAEFAKDLPFVLWAMLRHEGRRGETPEGIKKLIGPPNWQYITTKVLNAYGLGNAGAEAADPTQASPPNGSRQTSTPSKRGHGRNSPSPPKGSGVSPPVN